MSNANYLKLKVDYVKNEVSTAIKAATSSVVGVEYVVFQSVTHEDWFDEWLVMNYKGGAMQARACNGDSLAAILEEAVGMVWSSQSNRRGGNDTEYYKDMLDKCRDDYERPEFKQRKLTF